MEPEIARRCLSCGASVRGAAHFCPQCGRPMASAPAQSATTQQPALVEEAERVASTLEGRLAARTRDDERRSVEIDARDGPPRDSNGAQPADDGATSARVERAPSNQAERATTQPRPADGATAESQSLPAQTATAPPATAMGRHATLTARPASEQSPPSPAAPPAAHRSGEGLRPRVERLRERSVVVFDEAADDPGLRFVLVAAALFVVALLLYVFSFVLR